MLRFRKERADSSDQNSGALKRDIETLYQEGVDDQSNRSRKERKRQDSATHTNDDLYNTSKNSNQEGDVFKGKRKRSRATNEKGGTRQEEQKQSHTNNKNNNQTDARGENTIILKLHRIKMKVVTPEGVAYVGEEKPCAEFIIDMPQPPIDITFE